MKFESSFLVRVTQLTRTNWICLSPTTSLKALAPTRQGSIEVTEAKLENYVNREEWLNSRTVRNSFLAGGMLWG